MSSSTNKDRIHQRCRELGIEFRPEQTAKELEGKIIAHQLPDGMGQRIKSMFLSTWNQCADDWISGYERIPRNGIPASHVQEACADADRFDMADDLPAAAAWRAIPREQQDLILEWVFPSRERYGF